MNRCLAFVSCLALTLAACGGSKPVENDSGVVLPQEQCLDADADGIPGTGACAGVAVVDCNDTDPMAFPGAAETCNNQDDNCDGQRDEGLTVLGYYRDQDGDGVGALKTGEGCNPPPTGTVSTPGDCNDNDAQVKPGASETCNGVDDDCDGAPDDGLTFQDFYTDSDGDGFGAPASAPTNSCQAALAGKAPNRTDCDDVNPTVKPGAAELCNKVDDNCDGQVDNGIAFLSYYPDVDGDSYGSAGATAESSCAPVAGKVTNNSDCDDNSPTVKPGAPETCNTQDDDCDGQVDEGLTFATYYVDADGDGAGAAGSAGVSSCSLVAGRVTNNLDCNDANAAIKPSAPEACNGVDDNCNGTADDGLTFSQYFTDGDGDGYGASAASPQSACAPVVGKVTNNTDCNDANPGIKPGATELCNGVDDNCVGGADDGLTFSSYYPDADGDSYGAAGSTAQSSCQAIAGKVTNNQDCDDTRSGVKPGAAEACNGLDDNCVGGVDEGLPTQSYYLDSDGDGHGRSTGAVTSCGPVSGRVTSSDDCNDSVATTYTGAPELCNGVDDNCNVTIDDGVVTQNYYPDVDSDGFGSSAASPQASCAPVAGKVTNNTDCNDNNANVKPTAAEICNGVDDNCAGGIDNGLTFLNYYPDVDGDTYGSASASPQSACAPVAGKVTNNTDCNDANGNVKPGATEVCNGVDDNCAGGADEGLPTQSYWTDGDGDGFGNPASTPVQSCGPVSGRAANSTDCNDANANIRPTASESCNGVDDNCVGGVDEGNPGGGGACSTGQSGVCGPGTLTCTGGSVQCVRNVAPSAEVCDGLDNNCNGSSDETWPTKGQACTAGLGVCLRSGTLVCRADQTGLECNATPGSPTAASCDGLDNDCDGVADEPFLSATTDVSTTVFRDVEVQPYYFTAGQCASGASGASVGTDALQGGALAMGVGTSGIYYQRLTTTGAPTGSPVNVTGLTYSDVALAQASDGFIVAGIWQSNEKEIDMYYVDAVTGAQRTYKWTQFNTGNVLDSLRVVRANGKRVVFFWREAGVGLKMARAEVCLSGSTWTIEAPGCTGGALTSTTISPSATAVPGVGADSAFTDWAATTSCTPNFNRFMAASYQTTATSLNFFTVYEDGSTKSAEEVVRTATSPRTLAEPDVSYFYDSTSSSQWIVAYLEKDSGASPPNADLLYWLTNAKSYHYAYVAFATENGVDSIARPRASATASNLWLTATRYVVDASSWKRQIMTRKTDLAGVRTPSGSSVELSATSGSCGADPACRPGDKVGFTSFAPFGRVYYGASGSAPSGTYASTLTCN